MQEICRHVGEDGKRCRSPIGLVNGLCAAHDPGRAEMMRQARARGGEAATRKRKGKGLLREDLGPLDTPQDAARWLELIAAAVASGDLGHHEGSSATRALQVWLKAHESGAMVDDLRRLEAGLRELKGVGTSRSLEAMP